MKKLKDSDVRSVSFAGFNGKEAELRAAGIRIYGPGASAAMDFEPEYIGVTPDSRKAFVTLQENNAVAVIDIASASVKDLLPLGYKDQNAKPYTVASFEWDASELPFIGKAGNEWLRLGGFSGLAYEGVTAEGKLKFITNTDRGPERRAQCRCPATVPAAPIQSAPGAVHAGSGDGKFRSEAADHPARYGRQPAHRPAQRAGGRWQSQFALQR